MLLFIRLYMIQYFLCIYYTIYIYYTYTYYLKYNVIYFTHTLWVILFILLNYKYFLMWCAGFLFIKYTIPASFITNNKYNNN